MFSPSPERFDRGDELRLYEALPSLRDYLLVSTSAKRVEVFSKQTDGAWLRRVYEGGGEVELPSCGQKIAVERVYEGAELGG